MQYPVSKLYKTQLKNLIVSTIIVDVVEQLFPKPQRNHDVVITKFRPSHSNCSKAFYLPDKFKSLFPAGSRFSKTAL